MKKEPKSPVALPTLAELEREVVAKHRELGRPELARRRQVLADQTGELFPPVPTEAPGADAAHRTGLGETKPWLRPGFADASRVLSPAAGVGAGTASKNHARAGRKAVLHGRRHHLL